jgi:hypothetical protein
MPSPLEERIRELCLKAVADQVIPQLQAAVTEYVHDSRTRAAEVIPCTFRPVRKAA